MMRLLNSTLLLGGLRGAFDSCVRLSFFLLWWCRESLGFPRAWNTWMAIESRGSNFIKVKGGKGHRCMQSRAPYQWPLAKLMGASVHRFWLFVGAPGSWEGGVFSLRCFLCTYYRSVESVGSASNTNKRARTTCLTRWSRSYAFPFISYVLPSRNTVHSSTQNLSSNIIYSIGQKPILY
jgi:hypothetical protein